MPSTFREKNVTFRGPTRFGGEWAGIVALVLLAIAVLRWRWVGYQGHDDSSYAGAALAWADSFPSLGADHWSLRYPLVLPAAALMALFGPSVLALAAINVLAYAAFLAVGYIALRHWFGATAAMLLTGIGILLPQFPVQATYSNPDMLEMAFAVASFWALMWARARAGRGGILVLCGVLAGLGFLTRETSLLLIVLYGLLFLFRPAMPRWRYLLVAAGFVAVVGAEAGYFAVRTGDPLYRTRISATHDAVDRAAKTEDARSAGRALDSEGVLASDPWLAPFAAIFVSQKYGLLFLLAIPAYGILRRWGELTPAQASVVDCAALGALVAFLFVALNASILYVVPRYFMVPAALAAVPLAVLTAGWIEAGGRRRAAAGVIGAAFVASSVLCLYLENVRPLLAGERIVAAIAASGEPAYLDPDSLRQLRFLLIVQNLQSRVSDDPPPPGALVGSIDGVVRNCLGQVGCIWRERMQAFVPAPDWVVVQRFDPPLRAIAPLFELLDGARRVPADIRRKIAQPGLGGTLFRRPG